MSVKMVDVEVEYNYEAEQPDELSIKVGDLIKNVSMVEGGWWEGELNGKKGMFPDNFVKVVQKADKDVKKDEGKKKDVQATKRQSVRDLANKLKGQVHEGPPLIRKKEPAGMKKKRAKVVYSYDPENEDELKLDVGEMLDVIKQEEEGWWEGILNGRQGMFPSNFVEIIDDTENTTEQTEPQMENTQEHLIKGKKIQGVGLGNIFGDGPIKLRKTGEKKPLDRPQEAPKAGKREDLGQQKARELKPTEKALVRYSYNAENEDELSLTEGDIINILDKDLEDSGWWKGELNARVGVFPDNFVDLIKEDPKPKKPPPPTQPAMSKPVVPKLPEKSPVVELSKQEPHKEEKPSHPPVHAKKPIHPPPPITKKPVKVADIPVREEKKDEPKPEPISFEAVETSSDKLTHLTASRARGPQKRPPSQDDERNGDVAKEDNRFTQQHSKMDKEDQIGGRPLHPTSHPVSSRVTEPPATSAATTSLQIAIDELRKDMNELRANTVSRTAFNELKNENEHLKQDLESVKTTYSRRMRDIMSELDEEKKIRLSTQVEMERIRKIVSESHV